MFAARKMTEFAGAKCTKSAAWRSPAIRKSELAQRRGDAEIQNQGRVALTGHAKLLSWTISTNHDSGPLRLRVCARAISLNGSK